MDFCLLVKHGQKYREKKYVKIQAVNIVNNFWILLKNLIQMHLKLFQKEQAKKEKRAEAADDSIRNKNANKITRVS